MSQPEPRPFWRRAPWALLGSALVLAAARATPDAPEAAAPQALLGRHCLECHAGPEPDGGLDLSAPAALNSATWGTVWSRLQSGAMPPADHEGSRPSAAEVAALGSWLSARGVAATPAPRAATLRRLTRAEYERCVADLLAVHTHPTRAWPRDEVAHGFDTSTAAGALTPASFRRALEAAEEVADAAVVVFRPLELIVPADELEHPERAHRLPDGYVKLVTNGRLRLRCEVPHEGRYQVAVELYGDQAGPEPVRVGLYVDGRNRGTKPTRARQERPETLRFTVPLEAGSRSVEVAFLNDYYRPEAPPGERDRNLAVKSVTVWGPDRAPAPTRLQARLLGEAHELSWERVPVALAELAEQAYRRPLEPAEALRLAGVAASAKARGEPPAAGLRLGLVALLCSPHFLLRADLDAGPGPGQRARPAAPNQLAARLSFFLWGSLPDPALRLAAARGELPRELRAQAARLLEDPRASWLVEDFAAQWLQLRRLDEATPDGLAFPGFDEELRASLRRETELVFEALLREDRPARELIDGRFTFLDERLSRHYGWGGVRGPAFRRVALPPERSGVLTHGSVLTLTSEPERASLVKRGKWLLEVLLADPPPPPPPGADSLGEAAKARPDLPFAERLELHRTQADCRSCHARLDPLGVALERFDGIGAARPASDSRAATGTLPDGTQLEGVGGLRSALLARREQVLRGLGSALLTYALGRPLAPAERAEVAARIASLGPEVGLRTLVLELVTTQTFQTAWTPEAP